VSRNRLKIAVDLDGVLAESMQVWCQKANEEFDLSLKMEDLDSWSSWKKFGISKDDFYRILDESWQDWKRVPPTEPGIANKVARIGKFGDVDVVTGRSKTTEQAAINWVQHQKIRYRHFVRVAGWRDKPILNYDVYIDDAPDLMPLVSHSPLSWAILYDRPWNRSVPNMPKVLRAESWKRVPGVMRQIQRTIS
jgi:5'(3')-deoxyribonucleotidase